MSGIITTLTNFMKTQNIYPRTHAKAVFFDDLQNLETKITDINKNVSSIGEIKHGRNSGIRTAVGDFTINISFDETFSSVPTVIFSIETTMTRSSEVYHLVSVTTEGFQVLWYNPSSDTGNYTLNWIAISES